MFYNALDEQRHLVSVMVPLETDPGLKKFLETTKAQAGRALRESQSVIEPPLFYPLNRDQAAFLMFEPSDEARTAVCLHARYLNWPPSHSDCARGARVHTRVPISAQQQQLFVLRARDRSWRWP